jgi:hypothetical protein
MRKVGLTLKPNITDRACCFVPLKMYNSASFMSQTSHRWLSHWGVDVVNKNEWQIRRFLECYTQSKTAVLFQSQISTFLQLLKNNSRTMGDCVRCPWDAVRCSLCGGKGLTNYFRSRNKNLWRNRYLDKQPRLIYLIPLLLNLRHILYLLFSSSISFLSCILLLV